MGSGSALAGCGHELGGSGTRRKLTTLPSRNPGSPVEGHCHQGSPPSLLHAVAGFRRGYRQTGQWPLILTAWAGSAARRAASS